MTDLLDELKELHLQATTERSHFYVAKCCQRAITEIEASRRALDAMFAYSKTGVAEGIVNGDPGLEAVHDYMKLLATT